MPARSSAARVSARPDRAEVNGVVVREVDDVDPGRLEDRVRVRGRRAEGEAVGRTPPPHFEPLRVGQRALEVDDRDVGGAQRRRDRAEQVDGSAGSERSWRGRHHVARPGDHDVGRGAAAVVVAAGGASPVPVSIRPSPWRARRPRRWPRASSPLPPRQRRPRRGCADERPATAAHRRCARRRRACVRGTQLLAARARRAASSARRRPRKRSRPSSMCSRVSRSARSASPCSTASTDALVASASARACGRRLALRLVDDAADARDPEVLGEAGQLGVLRRRDEREVERAVRVEQRRRSRCARRCRSIAARIRCRAPRRRWPRRAARRRARAPAGPRRRSSMSPRLGRGRARRGSARARPGPPRRAGAAPRAAASALTPSSSASASCRSRAPRSSAPQRSGAQDLVDPVHDALDLDPAVSHAADCIQSGGRRIRRRAGPLRRSS